MKPEKKYIKEMVEWALAVAEYQLENPDRDWLTELTAITPLDAEGGDRPPLPPPKP